jgi:hypothetical protein
MKKLLTLLFLFPLFVFAQKGSYVLKMIKAEHEGVPVGIIKIDSIKPSKLLMYVGNYSDSIINASFTWGGSSIEFELTNTTKRSIKVIWNDAAYIDQNNNTGKIMHSGVKFIDRNNDQPSTTIISEAKITDLITPTENVYFSSGSYGGWRKKSLLPDVGKKDQPTLIGKKVKLLLPILYDSKQLEYVFTFEIVFNEYKK